MALIVETGLKEAGANSYIDVAFADTYLASIGNTDWGGDTSAKETALVVACQSLDLLYGPRYMSNRLEGNQSLLWPRYPFFDRYANTRTTNSVPVEVKRAQAELAAMYMAGVNLFPEGNAVATIEQESVKVGDIATSTTYSKAGKPDTATFEGFRKIDLLLLPVTKGRKGTVQFAR